MPHDIPKPIQASVAIHNSDQRFPVRRVFCVGRNYADHIVEMGNDTREPPFFFSKPADAVVDTGATIPYPSHTQDLHHEAELVVAIAKTGSNIDANSAMNLVWGYAAGIDLTRRDLQAQAKKMARPWDMSKGFDNAAPCGPLHPVDETGPMSQGRITLAVNGETRQDGNLNEMIWSIPEIIADLSTYVILQPGDLIFTGTPAGVSALTKGDTCSVTIDGLTPVSITISA